jgi:small conductance mechanosensitive channel
MNPPETTLLSAALAWLMSSIPQVVAALALAIGGVWLSRACERMLLGVMDRHLGVDPTLRGVLGSSARYAVLLLCLVAAIGQLGIQTSSILAVLATAGLAVGLALQATLSNIAAGIMLLWLRPFRVGDQIEVGGVAGRVVEVGLFASELHTLDGLYQFVPNAELWNKRLINYSRLPRRQIAVRVKLADTGRIADIRRWLDGLAASDPRVLADPGPDVAISDLSDDKTTVTVQAWTATEHYAGLQRDITQSLADLVRPPRHPD